MTLAALHSIVNLICIRLEHPIQVTADVAAAASDYFIAPFKGRLIAAVGFCNIIGGTTEFTDVDLDIQKATTTMLAAVIPVVNASAIVKTGAGTLAQATATIANARFAVGDAINLKIDITGGSSPTADGVGAHLFVVKEE